MRVVVVGAGGVGSAFAAVACRRPVFDAVTLADVDLARARRALEDIDDGRFRAAEVDASDSGAIVALLREQRADAVVNATDPRFNPQIFAAAFAAGCTYLDMAMTLSQRHPEHPYTEVGVLLGEQQFAADERWRDAGLLALVGIGVEPGLSDVFARFAADELFASVDEVAVRDGGNLVVADAVFAPTFSIWTTIEECLNPPLLYERGRGLYTTEPFSEPELFTFPEGIGEIECVNVEHEEVVLIPRAVDCRTVSFKYGLGSEFIAVLRTLHLLGLDAVTPVSVRGVEVSPRDVVAACLPDPASLGARMSGKTCAGTLVTGTGHDGAPRAVYLYHVADHERTMREYGRQAVVLQTALNPVVALELLATGAWRGVGVRSPEEFPPRPFLDLLASYGEPTGMVEGDLRRRPAEVRGA